MPDAARYPDTGIKMSPDNGKVPKEAHDLRVARGAKPDFTGFLQEATREATIHKNGGVAGENDTIQEAMARRPSRQPPKDKSQELAHDVRRGMMDPDTRSGAGAPETDLNTPDPWQTAYAGRTGASKEAGVFDRNQEMSPDPGVRRAAKNKTVRAFAVKVDVPDIRNKQYLTALRLRRQGDMAGALKHMNRALRKLPDNIEILSNRNTILIDMGRMDEALEGCMEALEMDPDHIGACANMGVAMRRSGRAAEAIPYYDKAIEHSIRAGETGRTLARLYTNKGAALADMGNMDDALNMHEEAIRIDTNYAIAYRNKAGVLENMGFSAEAKKCIIMALQIESGAA